MAAEAATPENIAFFLAHTSGVICVPLLPERADELDLPLMVSANTEAQRTAFTVSVDSGRGTTTGISAADRAATIGALIDPATRPGDLNRPGHIFPLRYRPGGVLKRAGHTEATVDLARAAGLSPGRGAVRDRDRGQVGHGPAARAGALRQEARPAADLDRRPHPLPAPEREAGAPGVRGPDPDRVGEFTGPTSTSRSSTANSTWPSSWARWPASENVLVRVHSECLTGDVFGSLRCDCGPQLAGRPRPDRAGGPRRAHLPARPRGPRHRARPQDPRLPAARGGPRHRRRQPAAGAARSTAASTASAPRCWSTSA